MRISKYRKTVSGKSRVLYIAKKIEEIKTRRKARREHILKSKHYDKRMNLMKQMVETPKTSIIKSQKLDTVSKTPIPQHPTILDIKPEKMPIIKMDEKVQIPEMEVIMEDIPIVRFPIISPNTPKDTKKNIPIATPIQSPTTRTTTRTINKQDYIIAIPSYNRPDLIQVKTLALLHRYKIPTNKIIIFVANQEQHDLYKEKIPEFLYGGLVIGHLGLKNQRNFIMDYFPEGQHIVQMDDDLDKIMELILQMKMDSKKHSRGSSKNKSKRNSQFIKNLKPLDDLDAFIKRAFKICNEKGIFLWGVYPLANARFMSPKVTTDLRFIVGPFWGIINRHRPDLRITIDEKENSERTLQYYTIDNSVLRFNNIGIETRYYTNKGGMQDEGKDRKAEALKSVYYLHQKYPKLTKIYLGKKSGVPEIRIRKYSS
jgi:hypothetical protein